ncbi:MAG: cytidylate kinase [Candidatus Schekmanbacteria bacterium RIFCSPHIGHO2_02_FULL_38_11]|uniref:Cytidylate kinase n=1 Tax=Candidatus Schekmanbacteria bacterium RIFCSPLOWO2_12_FULL_38_15 TaxID=1817883 RepID=A0A1F7SKG1_9BACT|nr:MAG: cytidylate kinase [Candidatus Schekmanbacteria bacterium GWA2_38_9]OGL49273.1 MAG: cytidylate kinase [Candidatus Schekmanbacteria bacterium RIFCSPLOWO2_02_FULL_38_14]OGL53728.1 MAG: cytidylate kinase [Candidatus Schekmanbacteria bacterium RIFCSPLOWO2_12_FULL_38_15]OGL54747.1 MAG: cytidylate kinase [Candidatus Schekmanbacteria bacterium RIFCSPHIGHO2_02_FULL_38_11]
MRKKPIIAIDGTAGAGKGTAGRLLAEKLNYIYVDSGSIYRALALKAIEKKIDLNKEKELTELTKNTTLKFQKKNNAVRLFIDGRDVSSDIRSEQIGQAASMISAKKGVREGLLGIQRKAGETGGIVMDGRDIGTVVFPDAEIKFFLDASLKVRSKRRYLEQKEKGLKSSLKDTIRKVEKRDHNDSRRKIAPLKKADDAIYIDTSKMTPDEVLKTLLRHCKKKLNKLKKKNMVH